MKLRGLHIRGSKDIEDQSLEFKDSEGSTLNMIHVFGRNGSGKSYIAGAIARGWSGSVLGNSPTELPYVADMIRMDFEVGTEIVALHIRRGNLEKSSTLSKAAEVSVGDKPFVKNGIIYYSSNRGVVTRSTVRSGSLLSDSVSNCFPPLYDFTMREIRDSVVIIDDWDMGLDVESSSSFYGKLVRNALSKGNQLVLFSSIFPAEFIEERSRRELAGRVDPVQKSQSYLSQVQSFEASSSGTDK
jgi:hypothetical protein